MPASFQIIPARFIEHVLSDGRKHIDVFFLFPGHDSLITYGISGRSQRRFFTRLDEFKTGGVLRNLTAGIKIDANSIVMKRKNNHRKFYWTYSGDLDRNGGNIREILRTGIEFYPFESFFKNEENTVILTPSDYL